MTTVLESIKHTTFPSLQSNQEHCFQTFSWEFNKEKRKTSLTLNSGKIWKTVGKVTQEFQTRQGEAGKNRTFKFQSPDSYRRLGGEKSAKFNTSRSENPRKTPQSGCLFPFKKSLDFQIGKAQGYKRLRICRCSKMPSLQRTWKRRGLSLCWVNYHCLNFSISWSFWRKSTHLYDESLI